MSKRRSSSSETPIASRSSPTQFLHAHQRLTKTGLIDYFEVVVTPEVSGDKPEPDSPSTPSGLGPLLPGVMVGIACS